MADFLEILCGLVIIYFTILFCSVAGCKLWEKFFPDGGPWYV